MKLNTIEKKTIKVAVTTGFTFSADSHFVGYLSAARTLNRLVKNQYLTSHKDASGRTEYKPTERAHDYIRYGIAA